MPGPAGPADLEATKALPNWGQQNTYTWSEVERIKIGKWFSVLRGR